jgi:phosphatidylglycerophosphate synthase
MSARRQRPVTIDARATGEDGRPLALAVVEGRPVIRHLAELVGKGERIGIWCEDGWLAGLSEAMGCEAIPAEPDAPDGRVIVLRCDRLYDGPRLRRVVRQGGNPESAVLWRLDTPGGLASAEAELLRRKSFQPLGRFWALRPAKALARCLAPTNVSPNTVTLAAGGLMFAASSLLAFGPDGLTWRLATSLLLALALVLDTADGHLARLQGRTSAIGRWLDATLDETADMTLHAAAAWAAYVASGQVGWLLVGMAYAMGKYVFFASNTIWQEGMPAPAKPGPASAEGSRVRRLGHLAGHADIRWHVWIVLAGLGWMRFELAVFAAYFLLRALAGAARKATGVSHA